MPAGQMSLFGGDADVPQTSRRRRPTTTLMVQDEDTLAQVVDALQSAERLSFDVETDSTDAMQATLVGLGVAWAHGQGRLHPGRP